MPSSPVFAPISQVLAALKAGRMVVLVDDANRENEGDLVWCRADSSVRSR